MPTSAKSYIIVGAGVFGASSAYHLAKDVPSAASSITLLDRSPFPCPLAASYDYQKVIRPDYTNLFHMRLAIKAQELWRSDPLWSRFYHESGIVKLEQGDTGRQMVENYKRLGVPSKAYITDPTTIQKDYPLFRDAEWSQAQDCFVNPESGWAEATAALKAATEAALALGVHYVDSGASKLLFDDNGHCCGVETEDGRSLRASHIILATGANTAKLIADSAPHRPEMQLEDRLLGCGVLTAAVKLTEEQADHFKAMPIFIHRVGGVLGEAYPPTPDRILKFTRDGCFTNKYTHAEAGLIISTPPPDRPDERQSECPRKLRDEIAIVTKGIFGKEFQGLEIDSYRICWCGIPHDLYGRNSLKLTVISLPRDAVTKNRDFLITPHPHCKGLYLATGGSFHGWKFLPIIGQYVAQMLEGALEEDLSRRWSWDRAPDPDMPDYQKPKRDWKDLRDDDESRSWWFTRAISSVFGLFWK